jgi:mutator protein MutT
MQQTNICFLLREGEVLLAMKKRGFGAGKWNGAGGKCETGETPLQAAIREVREEICVDVREEDMHFTALLHFHFPHKPEWDQKCSVFLADSFTGEPQETEEMRPRWFLLKDIPYSSMWADDVLWLPQVLEGDVLDARFVFNEDNSVRESHVESVLDTIDFSMQKEYNSSSIQ